MLCYFCQSVDQQEHKMVQGRFISEASLFFFRQLLATLKSEYHVELNKVEHEGNHAQLFLGRHQTLHLYYYFPAPLVEHVITSAVLPLRTIHLDEDVWRRTPQIVLGRIKYFMGNAERVFARKTKLIKLNKEQALEFQRVHHMQVALPGKYRLGLCYKNELVSVAVFSGMRKMHAEGDAYRSVELIRSCHKSGYVVVGGLSKLLKAFADVHQPNDIMTYVDRDWSDAARYEALGFWRVGEFPPTRFIVDVDRAKRTHISMHARISGEGIMHNEYIVQNLGSIKTVKRI